MSKFFVALCLFVLSAQLVSAQSRLLALNGAAAKAPAVAAKAAASTVLMTGYVLDADGLPLAGVTAQLTGTMQFAVTNADGAFMVRVPAGAKALDLTCSYQGLEEQHINISSTAAPLFIEMTPGDKPTFVTRQTRKR